MAESQQAQRSLVNKDNPVKNKLGQYSLVEKIAQGGMAEVYKAKTVDASGIERLVVIKRILPHISSHAEYIDMLIDEAKIAVHFTHGNIAQIYDLGRVGNDYFIVMEYVDGKTFSQIFRMLQDRHQKIPLDVLLYCFIELCHGLSYIHRKTGPAGNLLGVVHRDISPQNIILSYTGNVKVIDFGVAKATFLEDKTETGVLKGKFAYMSPEQTRGEKLDHRSDIFSLGTLLWEMVTGERLFKRKINKETIRAVQKAKFELPSTRRADVPRVLDRIIKKALGRFPRNRYSDANDMAAELEKLLRSINPDFRPLTAAKFLYDLFGPEKDEMSLPPPFFVKTVAVEPQEKTDKQSVLSRSLAEPSRSMAEEAGDETTVKEFLEDVTPIVSVPKLRHQFAHYRNQILALAVLLVFLLGSLYVYRVNRLSNRAFLQLEGWDPDMQLLLDGETKTVPAGARLELESGKPYRLLVRQSGYKSFEQQIQLSSQEEFRLPINLAKDLPPFGELTVSSTPPGAAVYLDERDSGLKTPATLPQLPAGKIYKIGLFLPGYDFVTRQVKVQAGKLLRLDQALSPTPPVVNVTSEPPGAEVFVDGLSRGLTPLTLTDLLPEQEYLIRLTLPGHVPLEQRAGFAAGDHKSIHHMMQVPVIKK